MTKSEGGRGHAAHHPASESISFGIIVIRALVKVRGVGDILRVSSCSLTIFQTHSGLFQFPLGKRSFNWLGSYPFLDVLSARLTHLPAEVPRGIRSTCSPYREYRKDTASYRLRIAREGLFTIRVFIDDKRNTKTRHTIRPHNWEPYTRETPSVASAASHCYGRTAALHRHGGDPDSP